MFFQRLADLLQSAEPGVHHEGDLVFRDAMFTVVAVVFFTWRNRSKFGSNFEKIYEIDAILVVLNNYD